MKVAETEYWEIEVLTPLHIGSGNLLSVGLDLVEFDTDKNVLGVLKAEHLLDHLLPENNNPALVMQNVHDIQNMVGKHQASLSAMYPQLKNVPAQKIATRLLKKTTALQASVVKEYIQSGTYVPLFPGSSLKGGISTALLKEWLEIPRNSWREKRDSENAFGSDPNSSLMRLLKIGDGLFPHNSTGCYKVFVLNLLGWGERDMNWSSGEGNSQGHKMNHFVEAVLPGTRTRVKVMYDRATQKFLQRHIEGVQETEKRKNEIVRFELLRNKANKLKTSTILDAINRHTGQMLEKEIRFWNDDRHNTLPDDFYYPDQLSSLLEKVNACSEGEAILQISYGSGFSSITGQAGEEYLVPGKWNEELRKLNKAEKYEKAGREKPPVFPKTRRYLHDGNPLGFIRIRIISEPEYIAAVNATAESKAPEKASKPAPRYFTGKLKKNQELEGIYLRPDDKRPRHKLFKLCYGTPGQEPVVSVPYAGEFPDGQRAVLIVKEVSKDGTVPISTGFKNKI